MSVLNKTSNYSLKIILYLLARSGEDYVTLDQIAEETRIPRGYLGRLINLLQKDGYVETKRGVSGGVKLKVNPEETTAVELLEYLNCFQHNGKPGTQDCCVSDPYRICLIKCIERTIKQDLLGGKTLRDLLDELT